MSLEIVELHDESCGSRAKILAGFGFNCYSFQSTAAGRPVEALWSVPNFESGRERPSRSGIPILFPFPGRIAGSTFNFQGRSYPLEPSDAFGNAIHGFVLNRPWKVIEQSPRRVVGQFQASEVDPTILTRWPSDFRLTVTYELRGNTLHSEFEAFNPGQGPLPIGLGTHAYFRVPLAPGGQADDCRVTVPAGEYWELKDMLATGRRLPVPAEKDLRGGMSFGQTHLDDVLSGLTFDRGRSTASIDDPASGLRLSVSFGDAFRECVVFNAPHREAICIEPYTCVPDAWRLQAAGVDAGARVLAPGETFRAVIDIGVESSRAGAA